MHIYLLLFYKNTFILAINKISVIFFLHYHLIFDIYFCWYFFHLILLYLLFFYLFYLGLNILKKFIYLILILSNYYYLFFLDLKILFNLFDLYWKVHQYSILYLSFSLNFHNLIFLRFLFPLTICLLLFI
jgi:hypothetical protein